MKAAAGITDGDGEIVGDAGVRRSLVRGVDETTGTVDLDAAVHRVLVDGDGDGVSVGVGDVEVAADDAGGTLGALGRGQRRGLIGEHVGHSRGRRGRQRLPGRHRRGRSGHHVGAAQPAHRGQHGPAHGGLGRRPRPGGAAGCRHRLHRPESPGGHCVGGGGLQHGHRLGGRRGEGHRGSHWGGHRRRRRGWRDARLGNAGPGRLHPRGRVGRFGGLGRRCWFHGRRRLRNVMAAGTPGRFRARIRRAATRTRTAPGGRPRGPVRGGGGLIRSRGRVIGRRGDGDTDYAGGDPSCDAQCDSQSADSAHESGCAHDVADPIELFAGPSIPG